MITPSPIKKKVEWLYEGRPLSRNLEGASYPQRDKLGLIGNKNFKIDAICQEFVAKCPHHSSEGWIEFSIPKDRMEETLFFFFKIQ